VDATGAAFTGAGDGFAVEDRVLHALDFTGLGLVTWSPGNVYVTQASGSIQRGVDAASAGNTVNVAAGAYAENVTVNSPRNLSFNGSTLHSLTLNAGASGSRIGGSVTADTSSGFAFNAPVVLLSSTTLDTSAVNGTVTTGAINGTAAGAQALTINAGSGAVNLGDLGASTRLGATDVTGTISLVGSNYAASSLHFAGPVTLTQTATTLSTTGGGIALDGAIDGTAAGAQALTINAGSESVSLGDLGASTRLGTTDVTGTINLAGSNYAANSLHFAGSITLTHNTVLDTSAVAGAITSDAINGTTAGAQALTINAGSGAVSLGDLGASTRLGATDVAGTINLAGSTYAANSLHFAGPATLTQATTSLNTNGGAVTTGVINGTAAGAQALTINAGSGTVSLGDLGATARLGAMDVTGTINLIGSRYSVNSLHLTGPVNLTQATTTVATNGGNVTFDGAIDGTTAGAQALTINAGSGAVSLGDLGASTRLGATDVTGTISLAGSNYAANSLHFAGPATLTQAATTVATNGGSVTLDGAINGTTAGAQALTINAGSGAVSLGDLGATTRLSATDVTGTISLTGSNYGVNSLHLAGPATLTQAVTTIATNGGSIALDGAINGTAAGAQALTINAGSGAVSLGDLGTPIRLGATDVSGATINLAGSNYAANSLHLTGPMTLTQALTNLHTSDGGGIAVSGDIQNVDFTPHALTLHAGTDGARGDVTLVSGGTQSNPLGALDVAANNFTLTGTLWVAGYRIDGRGAVALSNHTLNATDASVANIITAGGGVTGSTVGSGSIQVNSGGDVTANVTAQGAANVSGANVSGNIVGTDVTVAAQNNASASVSAQGAANVTATNVAGTIAGNNVTVAAQNNASATVTAQGTASITGANVSGSVTGNDVSVSAQNSVNATVAAQGAANVSGADVSGDISGNSVTVAAQGNVNATVSAQNAANISGTGVSGNFSGANVTLAAQDIVNATVTATNTATIDATNTVQATLNAGSAAVHADGSANLSGATSTLTLDAPSGSVSGSFGQITNIGSGLIDVNGRPQVNTTLAANGENNRVIPSESAILGGTAGGAGGVSRLMQIAPMLPGIVPVALSSPTRAADFIMQGRSVEIDLSPRRDEE
jgi:hypothetical protein